MFTSRITSAAETGTLVIQNVASWKAGSRQPTEWVAGSGAVSEDGREENWKEGLPGYFQDSAHAGQGGKLNM